MVTKKKKSKAYNPKGIQGNPTEEEWKKIKKFGRILKAEREKRGWTLESMEDRGWKSWRHWQYLEVGKRNITFATILRVCYVFKLHPSELWKQL